VVRNANQYRMPFSRRHLASVKEWRRQKNVLIKKFIHLYDLFVLKMILMQSIALCDIRKCSTTNFFLDNATPDVQKELPMRTGIFWVHFSPMRKQRYFDVKFSVFIKQRINNDSYKFQLDRLNFYLTLMLYKIDSLVTFRDDKITHFRKNINIFR